MILVAGLAALAASGPAWAEVAAELEGDVRGPDGGPLAGVDLVVTDAGGRARQAAIADGQGQFLFLLPAPGVWRLALHGVGPDGARVGAVLVAVPPRGRVQGAPAGQRRPAAVRSTCWLKQRPMRCRHRAARTGCPPGG